MSPDRPWSGNWDATALVVLLCTGISISNAFELLFLVLVSFKRYQGLYFWSVLIASIGILPYSVGFLIEFLRTRHSLTGDIMNNIGWAVITTGQSVVLYSRLGILCQSRKTLRAVKWMIIVDGFLFYTSTTIIHYGTFTGIPGFYHAAHVIEKIQMTGFCIQEFIISGIYIWEVYRYLKIVTQENVRRIIYELFAINLVIIFLDIALLTLEYLNYRIMEQTFKGLAYSFKLKMELAILSKLVSMAVGGDSESQTGLERSASGAVSVRYVEPGFSDMSLLK